MKVLLIQPPIRDFYRTKGRSQPLGLAYIAANLIKHGFEAGIIDCQAEGVATAAPWPVELEHMREFYNPHDLSPFKIFGEYRHYGLSYKGLSERAAASGVQVFGISCNFSPYFKEAIEAARAVKEARPDAVVVMGGAHASSCPAEILEDRAVDYVLMGEGEERMVRLLEHLRCGRADLIASIEGVGFRFNGEIRVKPLDRRQSLAVDSLPFPAVGLLPLDKYMVGAKRCASIITSRGCPHRCSFCPCGALQNGGFRPRSPEKVMEEIIACKERYAVEAFNFEDDNIAFDQGRFGRLLDLIIGRFGERCLELYAMNGIAPWDLTPELIDKMELAGFKKLDIALVSANPGVLAKVRRPGRLDDFQRAAKAAINAGLKVIAYLIIGLPSQTLEDIIDDLLYLASQNLLIGASPFYPAPGSELYGELCDCGVITKGSYVTFRSTAFSAETRNFNRLDLLSAFRLARALNFLKSMIDDAKLRGGLLDLDTFLCEHIGEANLGALDSCWDHGREVFALQTVSSLLPLERGAMLWWLLLRSKSFYSIRLLRRGSPGKNWIYQFTREPTSLRAISIFLGKSKGKKVAGIRNKDLELML